MAQISINKKLNLVIPLEIDNQKFWIYSSPLSKEVFEANYMLLTKTLSHLYFNGVGPGMAPRIAGFAMKDIAKTMDDTVDVSIPIFQEIYRLTYVFMIDPTVNKWRPHPYIEVKTKNLIDEETLAEVENALVYFIVASAIHLRKELPAILQGLSQIWDAQTTLLSSMDYINSLMMPIQEEPIGESAIVIQKVSVPKVSSIPS